MKVLWICHFSNNITSSHFSNNTHTEMAPWISNIIDIFSSVDDIELHILAPNLWTKGRKNFEHEGIKFYFYRTCFILPKRLFDKVNFNIRTNFYFVKKEIGKLVDAISPDIIHIHGAENPIYSISYLELENSYPILLTIQGFITQDTGANNYVVNQRKRLEQKILEKNMFFGVRTYDMMDYIRGYNRNAKFFWHYYPITLPALYTGEPVIKQYDCAFFGRVVPENGIEDLLAAISRIRQLNKNISLIVIGPIPTPYDKLLRRRVIDLGIEPNVEFTGYLPTQQQAFDYVSRARIDVLPTHYDIVPGTILECMSLGVPVIANSVGGIPDLNLTKECVVLTERGDIDGLSKAITDLLADEEKRQELVLNSKEEVLKYNDRRKIYLDIINAYKEILKFDEN